MGADDITRLRPDQRARLGMGIKLQVPSYYATLTASENVWLAAYARLGDTRAADARASAVLAWLGLSARARARGGHRSRTASTSGSRSAWSWPASRSWSCSTSRPPG